MHKRRFFSFSTSKTYEFELPEVVGRKCIALCYGWLLTIGYDLQINLLHHFTGQQINMPPLLSLKDHYGYDDDLKPHEVVDSIVCKAVMSSNPHNTSNQDCIVLAIYGQFKLLAFARPGDKICTHIFVSKNKVYDDVIYYKQKFYAVDCHGVVFVCDIGDVNGPKATIIARTPSGFQDMDQKYLVESSGFLLLVIRFRSYRKSLFDDEHHIDLLDSHTSGFSIFRLDECHGDKSTHNCYKLTQVDSLGDNALFIGYNASVSLPSSRCVKANCIYFSEDNVEYYASQPYGGACVTGIFDVESNSITSHYASEFMSHLTSPIWFI